jgi:hypothetical protein
MAEMGMVAQATRRATRTPSAQSSRSVPLWLPAVGTVTRGAALRALGRKGALAEQREESRGSPEQCDTSEGKKRGLTATSGERRRSERIPAAQRSQGGVRRG